MASFYGNGHQPPATAYGRALRTGSKADHDPGRDIDGLPPNLGQQILPHVVTFQGILRNVAKVYQASDEAIRDSFENSRFMRNDVGILECLEQRQRSTALLDWRLEPDDQKDPKQLALADEMTRILKATPRFMQYREALLEALWYGKYAVQNRYRWKFLRGQRRLVIDQWQPVNGDKLVFRFDDGTGEWNPDQVGIRVGAGMFLGDKVKNRWTVEREGKLMATEHGLAYFLENWERDLLAIHRHRIEDGEYEAPERAGRIHGVGIRDRIYWLWYQKQESMAWLMEYLERSAFGIEIWSYPAANPTAYEKTKKAAEERIGNGRNIVLVPKFPDSEMLSTDVKRIEPGMAGVDSLDRILREYFGHQIKRYILGQILTSETASTGLGSGVASIHLDTYLQIVKYDATNLMETMTREVVDPLKRFNFPEHANTPLYFRIDTESPDVQGKLQAWKSAFDMGLKLPARDVATLIGADTPGPEDEVLQSPQAQQAAQMQQQAAAGNQAQGWSPGQERKPPEPEGPQETAAILQRLFQGQKQAEAYAKRQDRRFRRLLRRNRAARERYAKQGDQDSGDHAPGWKTFGGGAAVHIGADGMIDAGCPGLKGEDPDDLGEDEEPEHREKREHRQDVAEHHGLEGDELSHRQVKQLEEHPHPETGENAEGEQVGPPAEQQQKAHPGHLDDAAFLKDSQWQRARSADYFDAETGARTGSSREKPSTVKVPPVGSWKIGDEYRGIYGHHIEQLQELDPHDLEIPEGDYTDPKYNPEGRGWDSDRYADWIREGKEPPPIVVNQLEDGGLRVADGHRRTAAAKKAGVKIKAWVSPVFDTKKLDSNGKPIMTGLTRELAQLQAGTLPADVLGHYPDMYDIAKAYNHPAADRMKLMPDFARWNAADEAAKEKWAEENVLGWATMPQTRRKQWMIGADWKAEQWAEDQAKAAAAKPAEQPPAEQPPAEQPPAREPRQREPELSQDDLSHREWQRNAGRVSGAPHAFGNRELLRAASWHQAVADHMGQRAQRGEAIDEDARRSAQGEADWYRSILKQREAGDLDEDTPPDRDENEWIAAEALRTGRNIGAVMHEQGMTLQEQRIARPQVAEHLTRLKAAQQPAKPADLAAQAAAGKAVQRPAGISDARWAAMIKQAPGAARGTAEEAKEHAPAIAEQVAADHLAEDPGYYNEPAQAGPQAGPRVGDNFKATPPGFNNLQFTVTDTKGDKVGVSYAGRAKADFYIPAATWKHLKNDLQGRVDAPANSGNPHIDAVTSGKAKFLGKGNDGMAFDVGDKIVKVSTPVPFHPHNGHAYLEPAESVQRLHDQVATSEAMRAAGVPGIMPTTVHTHGDKAFAIRDKLDIPETFTDQQLDQIRDSVRKMHAAGFSLNDTVQVGVDKNGNIAHYDTGSADRLPDSGKGYGRGDRIQHDMDRVADIFDKHGKRGQLLPWGEKAHETVNNFADNMDFWGDKETATRANVHQDAVEAAMGIYKDDPAAGREAIAKVNETLAKWGLGEIPLEKAPVDRAQHFEAGRQHALQTIEDPHPYHEALHGLAHAMKAAGRDAPVRDLANRWHNPLAGFPKGGNLDQAVKMMEGRAMEMQKLPFGVSNTVARGIFRPHNPTAENLQRTLDRADEDELPKAFGHAQWLHGMADDLDAVAPGNEHAAKLRELGNTVHEKTLAHRTSLVDHIEKTKQKEAEAEAARVEARKFDPRHRQFAPAKATQAAGLAKLLTHRTGKYHDLAKNHGIASDGNFIMQLPEGGKDAAHFAKIDPGEVRAKLDPEMVRGFFHHVHEQKPAAVVGGRQVQYDNRPLPSTEMLLRSPTGREAVVDGAYHHLILSRYPNAAIHLPERDGLAVHYKVGGKTVGIVPPKDIEAADRVLREGEPDPTYPEAAQPAKGKPAATGDPGGWQPDAAKAKRMKAPRISIDPEKPEGRAVLDFADRWGVAPDELADAVETVMAHMAGPIAAIKERNKMKVAARNATGLTPRDMRVTENKGFDFSSGRKAGGALGKKLARFDEWARDFANEHPGLGFRTGPGADIGQQVWDFAREKPDPVPEPYDEDIMRQAAELIEAAGKERRRAQEQPAEEEMVPFARSGLVERYRRLRADRLLAAQLAAAFRAKGF